MATHAPKGQVANGLETGSPTWSDVAPDLERAIVALLALDSR